MSNNRRHFLKATGMLATGLIAGSKAVKAMVTGFEENFEAAGAPLKKFGLQLYSLRSDMPNDPKGVLKQVAAFGYKQIESYEGPQGMFWGMNNTEFKKYMDDLGMTIVSSHCNINKDFELKAAAAGEIGMKYLICPAIGAQKSVDDYKKFADKFNACGEVCKKNGLRFAYHNHAYTFTEFEGIMPQDILMQHTDGGMVDYEMDIYWVVTAGQDPITWFNKYPDRFRAVHVKDRLKTAGPKETDASCDLGKGGIDYAKVLKAGTKKGVQYYIVEQEKYDGSTPLKSVETDANYMKALNI